MCLTDYIMSNTLLRVRGDSKLQNMKIVALATSIQNCSLTSTVREEIVFMSQDLNPGQVDQGGQEKRVDLRIRRTRLSLRNALLQLVEERGFEPLTVQD